MQITIDCTQTMPRVSGILAGLILRGWGWPGAGLILRGWGWPGAGLILRGWGWPGAGLILRGWGGVGGVLRRSPSRLGDGELRYRLHSAHWSKWVSTTSRSMLPGSNELVRTILRM